MGDVSFNPPLTNDEPLPLPGTTAKASDFGVTAGWTNERHSTYISSMEASFLDQLYGHRKHAAPDANKASLGNNDGLKVVIQEDARPHHGGCAAHPTWVRRFRPHTNSAAVSRRGEASIDDYGSGTDSVQRKVHKYGREAKPCAGGNLISKSKEVSDQNFSEEDVEANDEPCKRRRPTFTSAELDDQPT